jgi:hypothetical protein
MILDSTSYFSSLLIILHNIWKALAPEISEDIISKSDSPKQYMSCEADYSLLLSYLQSWSSEYSIRDWNNSVCLLTAVVTRDSIDSNVSYFNISIIRIDINGLACQFSMNKVFWVQVSNALQYFLCPVFYNNKAGK